MEADLVAESSLKAALDLNWDHPEEKNLALAIVLGVLSQIETHLDKMPESEFHPVVRSSLEAAQQIKAQDVELDEQGVVKLQKGVAKNRRITIEDQEMRHGRKNRSKRFDGYKRLRSKCTTSKRGRSVSIHPDEQFIAELRSRQLTTQGRAKLRERVAVEHSLSHIGRWQGDKARYLGVRKNLFDLRRTAVVHNLHVLVRLFQDDPE